MTLVKLKLPIANAMYDRGTRKSRELAGLMKYVHGSHFGVVTVIQFEANRKAIYSLGTIQCESKPNYMTYQIEMFQIEKPAYIRHLACQTPGRDIQAVAMKLGYLEY